MVREEEKIGNKLNSSFLVMRHGYSGLLELKPHQGEAHELIDCKGVYKM